MKKQFFLSVVALLLLALLGTLVIFLGKTKKDTSREVLPIVCPTLAKECPDGSFVNMTGPTCEFSECKTATSTHIEVKPKKETVEMLLGKKEEVLGVSITPLEILQDSRCPKDVQCIQAGTVQVRTHISNGNSNESELILELGKPISVGGMNIILLNVLPEKKTTQSIQKDMYRFVFEISKN